MEGGEDPYCRFPMRWDNVEGNPTLAHYRKLTRLRKEVAPLRTGSFRTWAVEESGLYAYLRQTDEETVLCVLNTALEPVVGRITLPQSMRAAQLTDLYSGQTLPAEDGTIRLTLEVGQGMILKA